MKYLVLGSNSFAGACFIDHVLGAADKVIAISRQAEVDPIRRVYDQHPNKKNVEFHSLDLNQHADNIFALIKKHKPNHVIDFASQSMVAESWEHPEHWYMTNIVAKVKLHQFLRGCDFLDRYVRISTPEVYGHTPERIVEDHHFNPSTPYAVSQAAIDFSLKAFFEQYQFPVLFTRFANFYGPGQQFYRIVPRTMIYILLGKKLPLHGGGLSEREFIYGSDVASAVCAAIAKGNIGESYHFSSGPCVSIATLVEKIAHLMHVDFESVIERAPDRPGKDHRYLMSSQKAEKALGWKAQTSLEQGLKHTAQWVKDNIDRIKTMSLSYDHQA